MKRTFPTLDYQGDPRRDLDEEVRVHLEMAVEDMMARGLPEEEARAEALGQRLGITVRGADHLLYHQVVGVVGNVLDDALDREVEPVFYLPFGQEPRTLASLLVDTRGDPLAVLPALRAELSALDEEIPLASATTLAGLVGASVSVPRAALLVGTAFGLLTLVLAAVGVFGVMASAVSERRREIGIRTALGRVLEGLLFRASAHDPLAQLGTALLLGGAALVAAWPPARQASRVDPMVALRPE